MPPTTFIETALSVLTLGLTTGSGQEIDSAVLWSGRLARAGTNLTLRVDQGTLRAESTSAELSTRALSPASFGTAACGDGDHATLALFGGDGEGAPSYGFLEQPAPDRLTFRAGEPLPAWPVSRPAPFQRNGTCAFGVVLADGTVAVAQPGKPIELHVGVVEPLADIRERPLGAACVATSGGLLVASTGDHISALDPASGATERLPIVGPVSPGLVAARGEELVFLLDARGNLSAYRPFTHPPAVLLAGQSPSPAGLTVWSDSPGGERLVWGTLDGHVWSFDGAGRASLLESASSVRWPILAADVLDLGSTQLITLLDDGSMALTYRDADGIVTSRQFGVAARASGAPALLATDIDRPTSLTVPNGSHTVVLELGQVTSTPAVRDGASIHAGEQVRGGVSGANDTSLTAPRPEASEPAAGDAVPGTETDPVADATPVDSKSTLDTATGPTRSPSASGCTVSSSGRAAPTCLSSLASLLWLALRLRRRQGSRNRT